MTRPIPAATYRWHATERVTAAQLTNSAVALLQARQAEASMNRIAERQEAFCAGVVQLRAETVARIAAQAERPTVRA